MFKEEIVKVKRVQFVKRIDEQIKQLGHNDFDVAEVAAFKASMRESRKQLVSSGAKTHARVKTVLSFLTLAKMACMVLNGNDEWEFRLVARMLTALINDGKVKMTPWEKLIYDHDAMLKLGTEFQHVPDSVIPRSPSGATRSWTTSRKVRFS
jgi:hypothetical protein